MTISIFHRLKNENQNDHARGKKQYLAKGFIIFLIFSFSQTSFKSWNFFHPAHRPLLVNYNFFNILSCISAASRFVSPLENYFSTCCVSASLRLSPHLIIKFSKFFDLAMPKLNCPISYPLFAYGFKIKIVFPANNSLWTENSLMAQRYLVKYW